MIGRIQGILVSVHPPRLLVDCQGIGYEVDVPMSTLYQLPQTGQKVTLLTHFQVREDAQQLFGFATETEREAFRQLIKISGVGSRTALAVLSGMSVNELAQAIALQEAGRLTQVPGIGKKTAERLCLELKGKLAPDLGIAGATPQAIEANSEVLQALLALGYSEKEALLALKQIPPDTSVSDGIRLGLKYLSKA
ncbi:Holliday junction branch migration protein RuvA [Polynucleobacter sp. UK-Kesae-W10]|uniref:Holliday junction branch migration protein RuvA n=1 Tax=Polynucleobacter sp. UK-Kesae-W10 TaxID=1819738 RepID=UPI001C0C7D24|nr:Holliday junction branch migration protein RuvA [Polynucleobacter sp. UK-Kesae-W10]MBU3576418.1 Holliday junction branch migration protein RuvA [Polynucleobacter sp. UK-Kesae-W10]